MSSYAVAVYPTPVFNTPDIKHCFGGEDGKSLPLDDRGLMRTVETVLFKGSKIQMIERVGNSCIWKIETKEYPYEGPHYIDERFVKRTTDEPEMRRPFLPSVPETIKNLETLQGTPYIWGGNWPQGIDLISQLYPPVGILSPHLENTWLLRGVDCTGLLYYVTNGFTPRNSSAWVTYGDSVKIEGLRLEEIAGKLHNLDVIAWKGHIVIVFDPHTAIESIVGKGVVKSDLRMRLKEIVQTRTPVDAWGSSSEPRFVVRRWHPDNRSSPSPKFV